MGKDRRSEILLWNVEFLHHVYVEHIRRIQFEPQMAEEIFV